MDQRNFATSLAPEVFIAKVGGNLHVQGWDRSEVVVQSEAGALQAEGREDRITIQTSGNCAVRIPQGATLHVENVAGNARLKLLEDQAALGSIHGSLVLRDLSDTRVESVHGDLNAKMISGNLEVGQVHGNGYIRQVQGRCTLGGASGNLSLSEIDGNVQASCSGNVGLNLSSLTGDSYQVECDGNLSCQIPREAQVHLGLKSDSENIALNVPGFPRHVQAEQYELTLGDGRTEMKLTCAGNISLSVQSGGFGSAENESQFDAEVAGMSAEFSQQISRQIESQIEAQMESITRQLNEQMSYLSSTINNTGLLLKRRRRSWSAPGRKVSVRLSAPRKGFAQAQEKMERKLEAARRRAEMKAEAAQRKSQPYGRSSWNVQWSAPQAAPVEPVSDEERLMILKMLEQKKITPEEAEQLLASLEGKA